MAATTQQNLAMWPNTECCADINLKQTKSEI